MLSAFIVVFREALEAALIIGIVLAACRGTAGRGLWAAAGIAAGLAGAAAVALFAGAIAEALANAGQEVFNASVLGLAVLMLGWHCVWMSRHAREMSERASAVARAVSEGARPLYAIAVVIAVAVLREGAETILFLHGIAAGAEGEGAASLLLGGAAGAAVAIAAGAVLYFGLIALPIRRLFQVTNGMVLLLAAGMASQAMGFLVQADLVPALGTAIWDTSNIVDDHSIAGRVLHALCGYVAQPSGIQIAAFAATALVLIAWSWRVGRDRRTPVTVPASA
jgi:high-affinity iron transporter